MPASATVKPSLFFGGARSREREREREKRQKGREEKGD